jgi:hypothetical protein
VSTLKVGGINHIMPERVVSSVHYDFRISLLTENYAEGRLLASRIQGSIRHFGSISALLSAIRSVRDADDRCANSNVAGELSYSITSIRFTPIICLQVRQ